MAGVLLVAVVVLLWWYWTRRRDTLARAARVALWLGVLYVALKVGFGLAAG